MIAEKVNSPRIFVVRYRSALGRQRVAKTYVKVPYGGLYGMTETMVRAMTTGQVLWFRIDVARPGEITPEVRGALARWPEALTHTSDITAVEWTR